MLEVQIKKLTEDAITPTYATDGSGGFDIYATTEHQLCYGEPAIVGTGLAFAIPKDHLMLVLSRSGPGFNENIRLGNCVGLIDSDYRGELKVKLTMDFPSWQLTKQISKGDRIAQAVILPYPKVVFTLAPDLTSTLRGEGGLGSTGVR